MHLRVCVEACWKVLSLVRWTNRQAFFMLSFYLKTIETFLISNLFCPFSFGHKNFSEMLIKFKKST